MKRKIIFSLIFVFSLFLFNIKGSAVSYVVSIENGASIRTKTEASKQGLRFTAKLDERYKNNKHGFYLVYGLTTVETLQQQINKKTSPIIINDKEVFKVEVKGTTKDYKYSVVLTGIPEEGYLDGLTAIPYVIVNGIEYFARSALTRSIAEVAVVLKEAGYNNPTYNEIVNSVSEHIRVVSINDEIIKVDKGYKEVNIKNIKGEFLRDWNQMFATNLNDFTASFFHEEALKPLNIQDSNNKDFTETNLYRFFALYKWNWVIDFIAELGRGNEKLIKQVEVITFNAGINSDSYDVDNLENLAYSIANFFNESDEGGVNCVSFSNSSQYDDLESYNKTVIANSNNYNYMYKENESIRLPIPTRSGYEFVGWYNNPNFTGSIITHISAGSINDKTFYAKWEPLGSSDSQKVLDAKNSLDIIFASGDNKDNVTKNITLPTSGMHSATITWATSDSNVITNKGVVTRSTLDKTVTLTATIKVGTETLAKTFILTVLKETAVDPNEEYTITFNLNGGAWPTGEATAGYTDRTKMVTDFLTDFYNFVKPEGVSLTDFIHGTGKTSGFDGLYGVYDTNKTDHFDKLYNVNSKGIDATSDKFINQPEHNKWVPLLDLMEEYTNLGFDNEGVMQTFWGSTWTGARRIAAFMQQKNLWGSDVAGDVATITSKIPEALKGSTPGVSVEVPTTYKQTDEVILPKPEKANDPFIGWYDNANLWGEKITKIEKGSSGNKTFYARYNSSVPVDPSLTNEQRVNEAKEALNITYASGDSISKVTKPITLVTTGLHGTNITWTSNKPLVISNTGIVTRTNNDETITLTATITLGSVTDTKVFTLTVLKIESYSITYNLNGGAFSGYTNKAQIAEAFLTDLYNFVKPSENLTTFMHGAGKSSGFDGTWYSNEEYRAKIYGANIKSGNNNYFLSHSSYQAKWKPLADFMVSFVKVGNAEQDYWSSPYTGNKRLMEYFANKKPGEAWTDADIAKLPTGLSANVAYEYSADVLPLALPNATKSGNRFEGWYLNSNLTGNKVTTIAKGVTGNKTYYAKWVSMHYTNPVFEPVFADPSIIEWDGTYYAYATEDYSYWDGALYNAHGPIISSTDLVNWKFEDRLFFWHTDRPTWGTPGFGIWAPDAVVIGNKVVVYYSLSKWDDPNPGIGVMSANHPLGPWTDHGKLFTSTEIGVDNSIDPTVFVTPEGNVYMIWGSFRGLFGVELSSDGLRLKNGITHARNNKTLVAGIVGAWNGNTYEAPYVIYKDNWYYMFVSSGTCCEGINSTYNVRVARSRNPLGPYHDHNGNNMLGTYRGYQVLKGNNRFVGVGHNAIIQDKAGNYYITYHGFDLNVGGLVPGTGTNRRALFIDLLKWNSNGWPYVEGGVPSVTGIRPIT